jgi:ubiquinone/menaquinone biosynthesis C-methylase UbiE
VKEKLFIGFEQMTSEELWDYNKLEYESQNIISKWLINRFYNKIKYIIDIYIKPRDKILEIGCGSAESSKRIFSLLQNCYFEASDFDSRYVSIINQKKYPFRVIQESVYDLKRDDNEFDIIFFLEVLEHLESPYVAIKELFRVSNKYLIVSVPDEPFWRICNILRGKYLKNIGNTPGHINHFNSKSLKKLIAPFSTSIIIYKQFPWLIAVAKIR